MAEQRRVVETKCSKDEAYRKCFKRASQLGLNIKANIPGERLEIERVRRTTGWWLAVVFGFLFYIFPGVLVLILWKPIEYCHLIFDKNGDGTLITAEVRGESGVQFFNDVSGILL